LRRQITVNQETIASERCKTQEQTMKKDRRWLKSIIAASTDKTIVLPFERGNRRRPAAFAKTPAAPQTQTPRALAAC
jgi:hypothetical protein